MVKAYSLKVIFSYANSSDPSGRDSLQATNLPQLSAQHTEDIKAISMDQLRQELELIKAHKEEMLKHLQKCIDKKHRTFSRTLDAVFEKYLLILLFVL